MIFSTQISIETMKLELGFLMMLSLSTVDLKMLSNQIWEPYILGNHWYSLYVHTIYSKNYLKGGEDVKDFSNFAYVLSMRYIDFHVCGASIIHMRWALTAAVSMNCWLLNMFFCYLIYFILVSTVSMIQFLLIWCHLEVVVQIDSWVEKLSMPSNSSLIRNTMHPRIILM